MHGCGDIEIDQGPEQGKVSYSVLNGKQGIISRACNFDSPDRESAVRQTFNKPDGNFWFVEFPADNAPKVVINDECLVHVDNMSLVHKKKVFIAWQVWSF